MNNKKGLLLGLGLVAALAVPVALVASCATENKDTTTPEATNTVLDIKLATGITNNAIRAGITAIKAYDALEAPTTAQVNELVTALNLGIFTGITAENLANVKATFDETDTDALVITLTANTGFEFADKAGTLEAKFVA